MGSSKSSQATTNQQITKQVETGDTTGSFVTQGSIKGGIVQQFPKDVADTVNNLINLTGDIARGAGDVVDKVSETVAGVNVAQSAPSVAHAKNFTPIILGVAGLAAVSLIFIFKKKG